MLTATRPRSTGPVQCPTVDPSGGGGGGGVSVPDPTGVFMSVWISGAVSARLYTRTSSIEPANHSPHTELPPMRSEFADVTIAPVDAWVAVCTPLTNVRIVAPS